MTVPWTRLLLVMWMAVGCGEAVAADNPRHVLTSPEIRELRTLSQNWTDQESNDFYNAAQGSRLVPYEWFLHLEQPNSDQPFLDADHIRGLGYLPRSRDAENPDGLPIGFIRDASYEDGTVAVGLTCAACHTGMIIHGDLAYLIDGGPTQGDFEKLMTRLVSALQQTVDDDQKFARFAAAVLGTETSDDEQTQLRFALRQITAERKAYNDRNLPGSGQTPHGPGRVDAFGAILNEVTVTFLGIPGNHHPADAPVSYPCVWDAPQHERVQWNGAADNKQSTLGLHLVGTEHIGALGRNAGEALGVFGGVQINSHELLLPRRYGSTVNLDNLVAIEESLRTLWSPEWPPELGVIDPALKAMGEQLFNAHCAECHNPIDRRAPDRKVSATLRAVDTDPTMARNFATREVETGRLHRRRKTLFSLERFGRRDFAAPVLKHVVERTILRPSLDRIPMRLRDLDSLSPGYEVSVIIEKGDQRVAGLFESIRIGPNQTIEIADRRLRLGAGSNGISIDRDARALGSAPEQNLRSAIQAIGGTIGEEAAESTSRAEVGNVGVKFAYKARPLNGIWATAPYLHNGSVPNLMELLKAPVQRIKRFHVGRLEFDPQNVGFRTDDGPAHFDTTLPGNSNAGHAFGAELTDGERLQLLEYLKSL